MQFTQPSSPPLNLNRAWHLNRSLTILGLFSVFVVVITTIGAIVDGRTITNVNGWVKPLKFGISFVFYAGTLIWMLSFIKGRDRAIQVISSTMLIGSVVELGLITLQVFRNTTSHFNTSTPFDATVYYLMALFVVVIWVTNLAFAIIFMRHDFDNKALGWALRLGLVITFIGAGTGWIMSSNITANQQTAIAEEGGTSFAGAHSFGAEDGEEEGLPFLGWNTRSGDMRVSHFFGLHGLQAIPLFAIVLNQLQTPRLNGNKRRSITILFGLGYLAFVLLTAWQALRGQPFTSPDGLTLAVLALIMAGVAVPAMFIYASDNQR